MNERFEDVRVLGADSPDLSTGIARARERLVTGLPSTTPRRRGLTIGLSVGAGLVAAATVTAVVIAQQQSAAVVPMAGQTTTPSPSKPPVTASPTPETTPTPSAVPTEAPPTAQTVLANAAASSAIGTDIPAGAYRKVTFNSTTITRAGFVNGRLNDLAEPWEAAVAYEETFTRSYYIPADRAEGWTEESPAPAVITRVWGDASLAPTSTGDPAEYPWVEGNARLWHHNDVQAIIADPSYPRDPQGLLDRLNAEYGDAPGRYLLRALETNAADPELQSAMLQAAALIPGATLTATSGTLNTITWEPTDAGIPFQVTVDTSTGFIVSSNWNYVGGDAVGTPADLPDQHIQISVEIVDTAPAPNH